MVTWKDHLRRAIDQVGSQARLAEEMSRFGEKYRQSNVSSWVGSAEEMPPRAALDLHLATNGDTSASDLRPDLWPTSEIAQAAATAAAREPVRGVA